MQFARFQVELKYAEVNNIGKRTRCLHGGSSENTVLRKKTLVQELYKQVSQGTLALKNQRLSWISINDDRSIRGRLNLRGPCNKVAPALMMYARSEHRERWP